MVFFVEMTISHFFHQTFDIIIIDFENSEQILPRSKERKPISVWRKGNIAFLRINYGNFACHMKVFALLLHELEHTIIFSKFVSTIALTDVLYHDFFLANSWLLSNFFNLVFIVLRKNVFYCL